MVTCHVAEQAGNYDWHARARACAPFTPERVHSRHSCEGHLAMLDCRTNGSSPAAPPAAPGVHFPVLAQRKPRISQAPVPLRCHPAAARGAACIALQPPHPRSVLQHAIIGSTIYPCLRFMVDCILDAYVLAREEAFLFGEGKGREIATHHTGQGACPAAWLCCTAAPQAPSATA